MVIHQSATVGAEMCRNTLYDDSIKNFRVGSQSFNIVGASRGWDDGTARHGK